MEYRTLSTIATISSGGTPRKDRSEYWEGDIPWISAKTLHGEEAFESTLHISEEGLSAGSRMARPGDILVLTRGSGLFNAIPIAWVTAPVAFNQDVKCLSVPNETDARYLFYWLLASRKAISNHLETTGIGAGKIDTQFLLSMEVGWPNKKTREKLVSFFDVISYKIRINSRINDHLLELMKQRYNDLFQRPETMGSIYDIAEVVYGAAFKSSLFNEDGEGWPLIRIRDLSTFEPQVYTEERHPKRTFVNPGDVVAGMDADFRPTFWLGERSVLNQRVCHFRPSVNSEVTPSYLLFALQPLLSYIQNYATGTTVAHLGKSDLEALSVPIPSRKLLIDFGSYAEPLRRCIVEHAAENSRLISLRNCLLPKLMSGQINVADGG